MKYLTFIATYSFKGSIVIQGQTHNKHTIS